MMVQQTEHVFINNHTEHVFINNHTATEGVEVTAIPKVDSKLNNVIKSMIEQKG
jgi:hypothetical protein